MVRLSSSYMNDFEEEFFGTPGNPESHIIRNEKSFDSGLGYKGGVKYEYQESSTTIACQNGGYISPDGIHTICSTGTTPIYPNGFVKYPVSLQESTAPLIPHLSMIGFHL